MAMHIVTKFSCMNYDTEIGLEKMKVNRWLVHYRELGWHILQPNNHN